VDEAISGLGEALRALGVFVGADKVVVRRVTPQRLRAGLALRSSP
jgi:hypothetical protein